MRLIDRILTIVVTATLTSAVWIIFGGSLIENTTREPVERPVPAPSPEANEADADDGDDPEDDEPEPRGPAADILDTEIAGQLEEGKAASLIIPVLNVRAGDLTDTFADARGGGDRLHEAIDIMADTGTTVVAAGAGEVEKLFRSDAGGKTIYVRSNDGRTIHYYAHLDEYAEGLGEGQRVRRGQRLGTVGSTGNASPDAPHLHFAILQTTPDAQWWEPANAVNPYPLLTRPRN